MSKPQSLDKEEITRTIKSFIDFSKSGGLEGWNEKRVRRKLEEKLGYANLILDEEPLRGVVKKLLMDLINTMPEEEDDEDDEEEEAPPKKPAPKAKSAPKAKANPKKPEPKAKAKAAPKAKAEPKKRAPKEEDFVVSDSDDEQGTSSKSKKSSKKSKNDSEDEGIETKHIIQGGRSVGGRTLRSRGTTVSYKKEIDYGVSSSDDDSFDSESSDESHNLGDSDSD